MCWDKLGRIYLDMNQNPQPERTREDVIEHLEHERPRWMALAVRVERTASLDRQLLNARNESMDRMNVLLEVLHGMVVLEQVGGITPAA